MNEKKDARTFKNWCFVINLPKEKSELFTSPNLITDILELIVNYYKGCKCYLIYHNKDVKEDGELKTPHLHCVLLLDNKRSKANILNDVSTLLNIPLNCVSVENCQSVSGSIRYLIHYDDTDKYQYSLEDIKSNDKKYNMYFLDIAEYIASCNSINDFMKVFGVDKAKTYLPLYKQSLSERNETPEQLKTRLRAVQDISNAKSEEIEKLEKDLSVCQENFDTLKNYLLAYLKRSNSIVYQHVSCSDIQLLNWVKNQFKE